MRKRQFVASVLITSVLSIFLASCTRAKPASQSATTIPSQSARVLHVEIYANDTTGEKLNCSIENHGSEPILLGTEISCSWKQDSRSKDGMLYFRDGSWNEKGLVAQPRFVVLPPLSRSSLARNTRLWGEWYAATLSIDSADNSLANSIGKLTISVDVMASPDLNPKLYTVDVTFNLPLHVGDHSAVDFALPDRVKPGA